ncbi:MAG: type II secretion system protein [Patescibacteria group bacterium]|nr:type II secretion system protein [Patescibacteria group bacterium]
MKILHHSRKDGFTLVEMLVVIAIIAILTGIIMANLMGSKAKSRDAKRVSDLAQIQLAIEQYFDRCNQYPTTISGTLTSIYQGCPKDSNNVQITLGNFISQIPNDPTGGNYDYVTNNSVNSSQYPTPTDYLLHATFETTNTASAQSATNMPTWFPATPPWTSGVTCNISTSYCVRPN